MKEKKQIFIPEVLSVTNKKMTFRDTCQIVYGYQCIIPKNNQTIIDCRIYTSKRPYSSRVIAAIWIHDNRSERYSHGVGIATGGGYHMGSYAIELAIREMGIQLDEEIGGRGYSACAEAFHSIMSALGYSSFVNAEFHA